MQDETRDKLIGFLSGKSIDTAEDVEAVADHLIAKGVIVPPCKVGDMVYELFDVPAFYDISELVVENVIVGINPPKCEVFCRSKKSNGRYRFCDDAFGLTLFFTKEEAEKALKERENNGC